MKKKLRNDTGEEEEKANGELELGEMSKKNSKKDDDEKKKKKDSHDEEKEGKKKEKKEGLNKAKFSTKK